MMVEHDLSLARAELAARQPSSLEDRRAAA
jgi:hypothetical protein